MKTTAHPLVRPLPSSNTCTRPVSTRTQPLTHSPQTIAISVPHDEHKTCVSCSTQPHCQAMWLSREPRLRSGTLISPARCSHRAPQELQSMRQEPAGNRTAIACASLALVAPCDRMKLSTHWNERLPCAREPISHH